MINAVRLMEAGVDYNAGMERFMHDAKLYEEVLSAFVGSDILERAQTAFEKGNYEQLLREMHEVKGTCGNAGFDALFQEASDLVSMLRSGSYTDDAIAKSFHCFAADYAAVRRGTIEAIE